MVVVYLVNGQSVDLPGAISVEGTKFPGTQGEDGINCLDGAGKQIGCFRVSQVAGFSIVPDVSESLSTLTVEEAVGIPVLSEAPEPQ